MNVFYNLSDPHSRSAAFSPSTQVVGDLNAIALTGGAVYTLPLSGNTVFFSTRIHHNYLSESNASHTMTKSGFFTFFNSDNLKICTVGWHDTASLISNMVVKAYNDAGLVTKTTLIPHGMLRSSSNRLPGLQFTIYVGLEPATGKARLTLTYAGGVLSELYDGDVTSVTNFTLGKMTLNPSVMGDYDPTKLADIIVTDSENYTIESAVLKPSTLAASNQFTGVIGNIRAWAQDRNYLSSSSELNVTAVFNLSIPGLADLGYRNSISVSSISKPSTLKDQLYDVIQYDQYFMGRYIQDGGVNISFTGRLQDAGENDLLPSHTVTVPANQDDTLYITKLADKRPTNLKLSALLASTVKYTLTGV